MYLARADWGAEGPRSPLQRWAGGQPTSKTAHYEGTELVIFGKTKEDYDRIVRGIQHYHKYISPEHYVDIAYNHLVSPIGDIYEGRGFDFMSGANGTSAANRVSHACCYIGGKSTPFTTEAQAAFLWINSRVTGGWFPHHHWFNTSCPGPNVDAWLNLGQPKPGGCECPVEPPVTPPSTGLEKAVAAITKSKLIEQDAQGLLLSFQRNPIYSASVKEVQDALNLTADAHLVNDGRFGFATLGAVRDLQTFWHMNVDGIVGNQTRGVLEMALSKKYGV